MYKLKKMERYLRVDLLGPGPLLMKKEFSRPQSHKGCEQNVLSDQTTVTERIQGEQNFFSKYE